MERNPRACPGADSGGHEASGTGGDDVPLVFQRNPRARRLILRVDAAGDRGIVVVPPHVPMAEARRWADAHRSWLRRRIAALPGRVPFDDGADVPILGAPHRIRHEPHGTHRVRVETGIMTLGGRRDTVAWRVLQWLRAEARRQIEPRATAKAATIGRHYRTIAIRDTRSRWGSCSSRGTLSFSWRLVMAPPFVLDYVVAHEVAHLAIGGHNPAFWDLVETLTGKTGDARRWLRRHGRNLHRFG